MSKRKRVIAVDRSNKNSEKYPFVWRMLFLGGCGPYHSRIGSLYSYKGASTIGLLTKLVF